MIKNNKYLLASALFFSLIVYTFAILKIRSNEIDNLGTFGDFIGGSLNPILSFLSFLILIQTIRYQHEALENSKKELELTRKELERSADTQEDLKKVQEQQARTQLLQQFENTFFSLLDQIKSSSPEKSSIDDLTNFICNHKHKNILVARGALQNNREIHGHYFRTIYQTLKFLDNKSKEISFIDIPFYKNILRSSLTQNTTILLAINSAVIPRFINLDTHIEYKRLIEKYSMLQHMPFRGGDIESNRWLNNNFIIAQTIGCYDASAFSENIYFQRIVKENSKIVNEINEYVKNL